MAAFGDLLDRLDLDANVRGRQFEAICRWYLTHDPVYRRMLRHVWLWNEWPGRTGPDTGIDLVAEDPAGHLWAIQAKAYGPDHTVTKRDIDTFLSASATSDFSFRLLIATTDLIGRNARQTVEAQETPVHLHMRTDLAHAQIEWPTDPNDLRAARAPIKSPRLHQQGAIVAVAEGFESRDRGQMIMACGTGKTLTALWITEYLGSVRTLVLVPSLSLLKDTLREWTAQASTDFSLLAVCSDPTVGGSDDWVSSTSELGFPVTTNPDEIASFVRQDGPRVVYSTYQSSPRVAEAQSSNAVPGFDLVIADEAHRVAGPVSSDFATVLDNSDIRAKRRLFTTATPRFFTDRVRKEAGEADFEIASMNDETKFGPEFHRLSFGEAIDQDLLSDYQVAIIGVDDPTYRKMARHGVFVTRDGAEIAEARTLASHIGLAKAIRDFDLRKTISFHSRISRARDFAANFPDAVAWMPDDQRPDGNLITSHVSGKMTAGQRDLRIQQLAGIDGQQRGLLSNARCLGEGIDVPTLDGVAFIDPRNSPIDIIQAVGRAIRKAEDKTVGTIVLPVFIDTTEDHDAALNSSAFKPIWSVLKAMRSHDDDLAEQLDELRRRLGRRRGGFKLPPKIRVDLPTTIDESFIHAFETRLVEATTASWEFWYGLLLDFVAREGHARAPQTHAEDGHHLGTWVAKQRRDFKWGTLDEERASRLQSTPGWTWDARESRWLEGLAHLRDFVERNGHTRVPQGQRVNGFPIGAWVMIQRSEYREQALDQSRIDELESITEWDWDPESADWEEGFGHLAAFVRRTGHANVPTSQVENGFRLGIWVGTQRSRRLRGTLKPEEERRLAGLPDWRWNKYTGQWDEAFEHLSRYVERENHALVPITHIEDDFRLGRWVFKQRRAHRAGELANSRVLRLESLRGWEWEPHQAAWDRGYEHLAEYTQHNGQARPPSSCEVDHFKLGQWVASQRAAHKKGRLKPDRVKRLETLDGWAWNLTEARWLDSYDVLLRYVTRNGHARVPQSHIEDGFRLGGWVMTQRQRRRKRTIAPDQINRLEALPGWTWNARNGDDPPVGQELT